MMKRHILFTFILLVSVLVILFILHDPPATAVTDQDSNGETTRVSVASDQTQGNGISTYAKLSADNRYVTFQSWASNLVSNDTNESIDIFVFDQTTSQTTRASISTGNFQGNANSLYPSISNDGRYVAFTSYASNLVPGDTNGDADAFVHDRGTGQTTRVSVSSSGTQSNDGTLRAVISGDGRYIAFDSLASNLVPGDTNGHYDIFIRDRQTNQTSRVSVTAYGAQANGGSLWPDITPDGRFISFYSFASNLVSGDTNRKKDVFVRDLQTARTQRVSVSSSGAQANVDALGASISSDGRYVAFSSGANNLVANDTNICGTKFYLYDCVDVFVHDRTTRTTTRVSVSSTGSQGIDSSGAAISGDGRFIAFTSFASNFVVGDTQRSGDVFVRDRTEGTTTRVSVSSSGIPGDGLSWNSAISEDGSLVAFESMASNLVPGDTNGGWDIFVHGAEPDIVVAHIEIIQATQNIFNTVPLIDGKPTVVRVYVECRSGCTVLPRATSQLEVSGSAGTVSLQPVNGAVTVHDTNSWIDQRNQLDRTLNYIIPIDVLSGTVDFTASVGSTTETETVDFVDAPRFRIGYVAIQYEEESPDEERIAAGQGFLEDVYPLDQVDYFPVPVNNPYTGPQSGGAIIQYLNALQAFYSAGGWPEPNGEPDQLFGWVPDETWGLDGSSDPPWLDRAGQVAFGSDSSENEVFQVIMSHEIGHNLGRRHPICDGLDPDWPHNDYAIHDIGFDFGFYEPNSLIGAGTDDYMIGGHCGADVYDRKWTSAYTFEQLNFAISVQSEAVRPGPEEPQSILANDPLLFVSGQIQTSGSAILGTSYQLTSTQQITQTAGSDYCLSLEDSSGASLTSSCFDLSFIDPETGGPLTTEYFGHFLPYDPAASILVLRKDLIEIESRNRSENPPTVSLLSPNGGETITGSVEVSWTADDADGDALEYVISYSADAGQRWYHLGIGITETSLQLDTTILPGSNQAIFKVTVSDGVNTSEDESDGLFTVATHSPKVFILNPDDGTTIFPGNTVLLRGYAHDVEDGLIDEQGLNWISDQDGNLGFGNKIVSTLSPGIHNIVLTAADSESNIATATVRVFVRRIFLPFLSK